MSRRRKTSERNAEKATSGFKPNKLVGRSPAQVEYIRQIIENDIVICTGPAGSGKTHIAAASAVKALKNGSVERIILCRPAIDADGGIGFLPGSMEEKMLPYLIPLFDELGHYMSRATIKKFLADGKIEIVPLSMMRGRTFNNCFVVLDEAQNALKSEIIMFLTRIGADSTMVITGDLLQSDLPPEQCGALKFVADRLADLHGIGVTRLSGFDIVRHRLIAPIQKLLE